jgi:uncharacterized membrane protein YdbT with pleckstrin-like domain
MTANINQNLQNKRQLDFDGQRVDEKLLFVFRRHIFSMRKGFNLWLAITVLTSAPLFIWKSNQELVLLSLIGFTVGLLLFFYHFILWYFTIYIVTNQRIRQIIQRGLFKRDVIELQLSKIQNISYNIPGIISGIFRFGTITIQTQGGDLIIRKCSCPNKVYNKLQDAVNNATENRVKHETIVA